MALGAWNLPPAMHRLTYLVVGGWRACASLLAWTLLAVTERTTCAFCQYKVLIRRGKHIDTGTAFQPLPRCPLDFHPPPRLPPQGAMAVLSGGLTVRYGASWPLLARLALGYVALVRGNGAGEGFPRQAAQGARTKLHRYGSSGRAGRAEARPPHCPAAQPRIGAWH